MTLLCFGYRIAVTVIQRGIRGFFSRIVGFVVKFIVSEKIAKWIADQGGWVTELIYFNLFCLIAINMSVAAILKSIKYPLFFALIEVICLNTVFNTQIFSMRSIFQL